MKSKLWQESQYNFAVEYAHKDTNPKPTPEKNPAPNPEDVAIPGDILTRTETLILCLKLLHILKCSCRSWIKSSLEAIISGSRLNIRCWSNSHITWTLTYPNRTLTLPYTPNQVDLNLPNFSNPLLWSPSSSAALGYKISLASQGVRQTEVKGKITTDGVVMGTVEEHLNQAVSMTLTACLDHPNNDYKFGFGISIGGNL